MTVSAKFRAAYVFFREHAGYVVGENAKGAASLARAERWASNTDVQFRWIWDEDADWSWMTETEEERTQSHEAYGCIAVRICDECRLATCGHAETLASLWGIFDPSDDYRRVVEAELALEAMQAISGCKCSDDESVGNRDCASHGGSL